MSSQHVVQSLKGNLEPEHYSAGHLSMARRAEALRAALPPRMARSSPAMCRSCAHSPICLLMSSSTPACMRFWTLCQALADTSATRTPMRSCWCPVPGVTSCKWQVYVGSCALGSVMLICVAHMGHSTRADELRHLRRLCGSLKGNVGALHSGAEHRVLPLRVQQPMQREAQPPVARRPAHE